MSATDNPFLAQLGLTVESFRETEGKAAADLIVTSLGYVIDQRVSLELRIDITRRITKWQEKASPANRTEGIRNGFAKLLGTVSFLLDKPDEPNSSVIPTDASPLSPAYYLAQVLNKEATSGYLFSTNMSFLGLYIDFIKSAVSMEAQYSEKPQQPDVRTETLKYLVNGLPNAGLSNMQEDVIVSMLFQFLPKLGSAPTLRVCVVQKIIDILHHATSTSAIPVAYQQTNKYQAHNPTETVPVTTFDKHIANMLQSIHSGHAEFIRPILSNKSLCHPHSPSIEHHLSAMIENIGFGDLEALISEIAEVQPRKLLKSLHTLVRQLSSVQLKHRVLIMSVFLTVALVVGSAPLLPLLGEIGVMCSTVPELYISLFKLLTTLSSGEEECAMQALVLVSSIAKNNVAKTPHTQSALLECVNILKDQCKYCNIFHTDTLKVLETYSPHNPAAYKNLVLWNSGKSAKKGNNQDFLMNAGAVVVTSKSAGESKGGVLGRWFGSPKKATTIGVDRNSSSASGATGNHDMSTMYPNSDVRPAEGTSAPLANTASIPTSPIRTSHFNAYSTSTSDQSLLSPGASFLPYSSPTKGHAIAPSPQSQNLAILQQQLHAQQQQLHHQMLLMQQMQIQDQLAQFESNNSTGDYITSGSGATANSYSPYVIGVQRSNGASISLNPPQSPEHVQTMYDPYSNVNMHYMGNSSSTGQGGVGVGVNKINLAPMLPFPNTPGLIGASGRIAPLP